MDSERRIFLRQLAESDAHLFLIGFGLRLDGHSDNGLRKVHGFEKNLFVLVADGVTGCDVSQTDSGRNVTGKEKNLFPSP